MKLKCLFCEELLDLTSPTTCSCGGIEIGEGRTVRAKGTVLFTVIKEPLTDYINRNYNSINDFYNKVKPEDRKTLSKTYLRYLIDGTVKNPTIFAIMELASLTGLDEEELYYEFRDRLRNGGARD